MSNLDNYILASLNLFLDFRKIYTTETNKKLILEQVKTGKCFAYQIIYTPYGMYKSYTYEANMFKPLDINKLCFHDEGFQKLWRYDRGTHQTVYGTDEILTFNREEIRNLKIEEYRL